MILACSLLFQPGAIPLWRLQRLTLWKVPEASGKLKAKPLVLEAIVFPPREKSTSQIW